MKKNMKNQILIWLLICTVNLFAQDSKKEKDVYLAKANKEFADKKYAEAESNYRISASKFPESSASSYNLGNTIYSIDQPSEAKFAYMTAISKAKTRAEKHKAFHNLGNVYMKEKKYTEAVNTYKSALINNPQDDETRYNYALAKKLLKDNPPPPQDDKKDDKQGEKDQKEKDKDKKDQNKDKNKDQSQDQKDQENKDKNDGKGDQKKDKEQDQNQQKQPSQGGISKQQLESMLEAVNNEEKKVQDKVNVKKVKGQPVRKQKDW